MKRFVLLGAVVAVAAIALPSAAMAGRLSGVVVAKDAARRSVAIAVRGEVRTVRTTRFGVLEVGRRITATGAPVAGGTFAARTVKAGARLTQVQFRAVVVRHEAAKQRLIVSAGGTVFAFRLAGGRTFASDGGLSPGDKITVSANVKKQELEAQHEDVKETGHVEALKLEGIFLHQGQDSFDIAVVHRGLVHIRFTPGSDLPEWKPGDIVFVVVSVGDGGSFTFVGGRTDGKPGEGTKPEPTIVAGTLSERSATQVSVLREDGTTVTCAVPVGWDLSVFSAGEKVYMSCRKGENGLVLLAIKSANAAVTGPKPPENQLVAGVLSDRNATQVTVQREDGTIVTCAVPPGWDVSVFAPGEKVQMYCKKTDGGLVLVSIKSERAWMSDGKGGASFVGTLAEVSGSSSGGVSLKTEDGRLVACAAPAGLDLSAFRAGDKVKLTCALRSGHFFISSLRSERAFINLETSEVGLIGTLAERTSTSVTVNADGATLHCTIATPVDLSLFTLGQKVSLSCKRTDGGLVYALLYADSVWVKADGTAERTVYGTFAERAESSVTVMLEGGPSLTCAAPSTVDLSAFHTGDKVKMRCRLGEGTWRLSLLRSETATVEVPL
jgi:hypothetical protein